MMKIHLTKKVLSTIISWVVTIAVIVGLIIYIDIAGRVKETSYDTVPGDKIVDVPTLDSTKTFTAGVNSYELIDKNDKLELYICRENTEIAVKNLADGKVWFSNPVPSTNEEGISETDYRQIISVSYFTDSENQSEHNNFDHAISIQQQNPNGPKQFDITKTKDGIEVIYRLGAIWKDYVVPFCMPKADFEKLMADSRLSELDRLNLKYNYTLIDREKAKDAANADKLKTFPIMATDDVYVINTDLDPELGQNTYAFEKLEPIFKGTLGMTMDQVKALNEKMKVQAGFSNVIKVFVDYTLQGDSLVVKVPVNRIWMQKKLKYRINRIDLFKYFGAGTVTDNGYMFVPDRTGTLINFNNDKLNQSDISIPIYGRDKTVMQDEENASESIGYFPVFGIKNNNAAVFGIVTKGAEYAHITANVAAPGSPKGINIDYPSFTILASNSTSLSSVYKGNDDNTTGQSMTTYQKLSYQGDLEVRYSFLTGSSANYAGMANYYRNYLLSNKQLKTNTISDDLPMLVSFLGGVETKKAIAGIPMNIMVPLTKYEQAEEVAKKLQDSGVKNLSLRLEGWSNGGLASTFYDRIKLISTLGGKHGFNNLVQYTNEKKIGLYPDANFLYVYKTGSFDGFSSSGSTARFLNSGVAYNYSYSPVTGMIDELRNRSYIVRQTLLPEEVTSFVKYLNKYDMSGVSASTLGSDLNSDFNDKSDKTVGREKSALLSIQALEALNKSGKSIMVDGGNAYALAHAGFIANAPDGDNGFVVSNEKVPFYQMVLHGLVPYTISSINQADDATTQFLKSIELDAGLSYRWIYSDNVALKDISFNVGDSLNYKEWLGSAVQNYKTANEALKGLHKLRMTDHYRAVIDGALAGAPPQEVYVTVYENGTKVIVNYTVDTVSVGGIKVAAKNFVVVH